jgi:catechol 2,3-dioxygenase-like lactoylglutathione lyase family enzyme
MERPTHAGLRHLALHVQDFAAMRHFCVDILGFAVEWEPDPDNVYLSSGIDNRARSCYFSDPTGTRSRSVITRLSAEQPDMADG